MDALTSASFIRGLAKADTLTVTIFTFGLGGINIFLLADDCVPYRMGKVIGVATLLLVAVDSTGVQASIALAADHLVPVVFLSELAERRLNDATSQAQHQVQGGLFLDVVV
ncbi:hypothetical protein P7K49_021080 [Saguinus oedipus]|uniref:Uncharacterized protein n=1 Tax=Saguinus oedipus TaxID=9490 RepID=A0ABQ9URP7_SAGOE|nr:hypothetical protein P7K49_021080 [Saguinus oedipus]